MKVEPLVLAHLEAQNRKFPAGWGEVSWTRHLSESNEGADRVKQAIKVLHYTHNLRMVRGRSVVELRFKR